MVIVTITHQPNCRKAVWRSVFLTIWHCILNADSTKTRSSRVTFCCIFADWVLERTWKFTSVIYFLLLCTFFLCKRNVLFCFDFSLSLDAFKRNLILRLKYVYDIAELIVYLHHLFSAGTRRRNDVVWTSF